jgi:hypothetical protein
MSILARMLMSFKSAFQHAERMDLGTVRSCSNAGLVARG